ncbi:MAG: exodeoxyribonuclease V subunit beta, partial [Gammaproteobacteria bacterium]
MTDSLPDSNLNSSLKPGIKEMQPLIAESLPLQGCHLIEASAGTGKTYNITRIYLRLLLEEKLDVKNILVMTFTRAATEELRGRIAREIRNALDKWGHFDKNDTFFAALTEKFTIEDVNPVLHNALLHLDEASIFTIHSFCKRVLSQQAFSSGVDFNVQMETDTAEIELEAVRDWYRTLAYKHKADEGFTNDYQLLIQYWPAPDNFRKAFSDLLSSTTPVQANTPESIQADFQQQKSECLQHLQAHQSFVFEVLIDSHKEKFARTDEWQVLMNWLNSDFFELSEISSQTMPKEAAAVFNGNRYGRKPADIKQQLLDLFAPVKQLKEDAAEIEKQIEKSRSYQIAAQGIDFIRRKISQAKQRARVMNYDDLINQLAAAAAKENNLTQLIKEQYPVALVDEFQDTDPQQYAILKAVYQSSKNAATDDSTPGALYMIGDPKQAIYAFRSGDVFTYLAARDDADKQWLMDTNWRSSSNMVNAYNRLFYGASLPSENESGTAQDVFGFDIQYIPVKAADKADKTPLTFAAGSAANKQIRSNAALQLIYFPFNEDYRSGRSKKEEMTQNFCS